MNIADLTAKISGMDTAKVMKLEHGPELLRIAGTARAAAEAAADEKTESITGGNIVDALAEIKRAAAAGEISKVDLLLLADAAEKAYRNSPRLDASMVTP